MVDKFIFANSHFTCALDLNNNTQSGFSPGHTENINYATDEVRRDVLDLSTVQHQLQL